MPEFSLPDNLARAIAFNRACRVIALLWLTFVISTSYVIRPTAQDVPPYYMGGQIALRGAWKALYPSPLPDARYNLGWPDQSTLHPEYLRIARAVGVGDDSFRFIHLPSVALAFVPLALFDFHHAIYIWAACLTLCAWGVAWLAGDSYSRCAGRVGRVEGIIVLLVATSPLIYRAIRVGNVSVITALCVGWIGLDLAASITRPEAGRRCMVLAGVRTLLGAMAMVIGFFAKYVTPVLVPLYILTGRWRSLMIAAALGVGTLGITWLVAGTEPFVTFARDVAPSLSRSHPNRGNQSVEGLLIRLTHVDPLPQAVVIAVRIVQAATLAVILLMLWGARKHLREAQQVCAGIVALIAWLLIFSPIYWDHYTTYFMPFWGWACWQARLGRWRAAAGCGGIALCWFPLSGAAWVVPPEPLTSPNLLAAWLFMGLALWQLRSVASWRSHADVSGTSSTPTG